jgi:hypothetical protein
MNIYSERPKRRRTAPQERFTVTKQSKKADQSESDSESELSDEVRSVVSRSEAAENCRDWISKTYFGRIN